MASIKYKIYKREIDVTLDENEYIANQIGKAFIGGDGWVYEVTRAVTNSNISGGFTIVSKFNEQSSFKVCYLLGKNKYNHEIWTGNTVIYKNRKYFISSERFFFRLCGYLPSELPILITPEVLLDIELDTNMANAPEIEPEFEDEMFRIEKKL